MEKSIDKVLKKFDLELSEVLKHLPKYHHHPRLPPEWLHWQIIERDTALKHAGLVHGADMLEVGCGTQAISTIPLALSVGERGKVVALDLGRWAVFEN